MSKLCWGSPIGPRCHMPLVAERHCDFFKCQFCSTGSLHYNFTISTLQLLQFCSQDIEVGYWGKDLRNLPLDEPRIVQFCGQLCPKLILSWLGVRWLESNSPSWMYVLPTCNLRTHRTYWSIGCVSPYRMSSHRPRTTSFAETQKHHSPNFTGMKISRKW